VGVKMKSFWRESGEGRKGSVDRRKRRSVKEGEKGKVREI
jgi:hypothetical protein